MAPHGIGCPSHNVQRTKPNETCVTTPVRWKTGQMLPLNLCLRLCVFTALHKSNKYIYKM